MQRCETPVAEGWRLEEPFHGREGEDADGGSVLVEDLDQDGDLDLIASWDSGVALHVWRNQGDGSFVEEEVSVVTPGQLSRTPLGFMTGGGNPTRFTLDLEAWDTLTGIQGGVREAAWVEGVGMVLLLSSPTGDGQDFVLGQGSLGPLGAQAAFDGVVFDQDQDGDADLYVVNDEPVDGRNVLWRQEEGQLVATEVAGLRMSGMGADVGDLDGDGLADLYLTAAVSNVLLLGQPDHSYVDATATWQASPIVSYEGMGWGGVFWDADNDGDLDLAVAQGDFAGSHALGLGPQPLSLLRNQGGRFEHEVLLEGNFRGVVPVDLNGDGVLDLVVSRVSEGPLILWSQGCSASSWLVVEGPVGARVEVDGPQGAQTAWISTDSGFSGAKPARVHLGLGDLEQVQVRVTVDGRTRSARVQTRQVVRVLP